MSECDLQLPMLKPSQRTGQSKFHVRLFLTETGGVERNEGDTVVMNTVSRSANSPVIW